MEYDPTPIPENFTYNGTNLRETAEWAWRTIDHYELPNDSVIVHNRDGQHPTLNDVQLTPGTEVTFDERTKRFAQVQEPWVDANGPVSRSRQFDQGPEILARDHPMTVAESASVQAAQRKLGTVSIPEPGREFVHRRAAGHLDATTVPDSALLGSMQRHPSNSLSQTPASRYTLAADPGNPQAPVVRLPPRIT